MSCEQLPELVICDNWAEFKYYDDILYQIFKRDFIDSKPMFDEEIAAFLRSVQLGERQPSHIDTVIITARMMQALYDSSDAGKEIVLD